jgi:hypothetical protein
MLGTKVGLNPVPLLLRVAQGHEERCLEPAHGMGRREEVVAELGRINDRPTGVG